MGYGYLVRARRVEGVFGLYGARGVSASAPLSGSSSRLPAKIPPLRSTVVCLLGAAGLAFLYILTNLIEKKEPHEATGYSDGVVRAGVIATVFWGVAGFLVGVIIAWQLAYPVLNLDLPWTSFGRLRPLHTSAVIFAFGGNILIATSFYVVQRTCRRGSPGGGRPGSCSGAISCSSCWRRPAICSASPSPEYAEPEWYVDLWLTVVWVTYFLVFVGTLAKRREPHIYVANWFYLAFIVTIAMLHIVNNLAIPVSLLGSKSYVDLFRRPGRLTQWWYGHNAVGFFLTAGFLGMMYYFIPKRAERPVYSYRLSIVHFWSLIFLYIWAGPHHLHYTALPDWAQTLGMTFSIMLWMPSWGGMINGMMTLSGAWDKLRTDPVIRFLIVSVAFYGMATFEGPLMSIRSVNALSHYTDWTIGHVHSGALGWVAFISFGAIYCLVPWLWHRKALYSQRSGRVAFLDRDAWHPALHHLDVGGGHPAGSDVARLRQSRLPRIFLCRDGRCHAPVLCHPGDRRPAVLRRIADHGLQCLANHSRRRARRCG